MATISVRAGLERLAVAANVSVPGARGGAAPAARAGAAGRAEPRPLRTERMSLRPLRAADCVEFLRVVRLNREHLARFFPLAHGEESDLEILSRELRLGELWNRRGSAPDWRRAPFSPDGRVIGCFKLHTITRRVVVPGELTLWGNREVAGPGD